MASQIPPGTDLSKVPAGEPPAGVTPNFHDPPSLMPTLIGMCALLIPWGTIFAAVRIYTNRKRLQAGDYFVIVAVILSIAYCSILLSFASYFRHSWDLPLSWYTPSYIKKLYAQGVFLGPTIFFSKEAIFLLYFQLFNVKRSMKIATIIGMIFTGLAYWPGVGIESYFCAAHPGETWDPLAGSPESKRCSKTTYWGITQGACAIAIDIYIFILLIPAIIALQLAPRRKLQVLGVFTTAFLGILASTFAEVYRIRLLTNSKDLLWVQGQQLICVVVEDWVAIIVSCMPAFATFTRLDIGELRSFKSLQSRLLSWTTSKTASKKQKSEQDTFNLVPKENSEIAGSLDVRPYYRMNDRAEISMV